MTTTVTARNEITADRTGSGARSAGITVQVRRITIIALLAMVTLLGFGVQNASATTTVVASGRPGVIYPVVTQGVLSYYRQPGALYGSQVRHLQINAPTVTRSAAYAGTQNVAYWYAVQQWNGATWVQVFASSTQIKTIQGNAAVTFAPGLIRTSTVGYYRVTMGFVWQASNGAMLGQQGIRYTQAGDYQCRVAGCSVGAGWIYF